MPDIDIGDLSAARRIERSLVHEMQERAPTRAVDIEDLTCTRADGSAMSVRVYRPRSPAQRLLPALLFIHGGSFVTGGLLTEHDRCASYAEGAGCLVASVDYRLAPEHIFPAALDDCVTALDWLLGDNARLDVDPARVAIGGLSAGGALAASAALLVRDRGGPPLALQMLLFPALDAACSSSTVQALLDTPVLTAATVRSMWQLYLGPDVNPVEAPRYASPAAESDLAGLPPAYLCVAQIDPLRDEALAYGMRLLAQGVAVDLRHYARAFHAFDGFLATRLAQAAREDQLHALRAAFM